MGSNSYDNQRTTRLAEKLKQSTYATNQQNNDRKNPTE